MTTPAPEQRGRIRRTLMPHLLRFALTRRVIGILAVYRSAGGGLTGQGLAYSGLFALIPALVLVVGGVTLLLQDEAARDEAIDIIRQALPALQGLSEAAIESVQGTNGPGSIHDTAIIGSLIAIAGLAWAASGLYLNLTRAMERFFPGERVSGMLARALGVLVVLLLIVGVVAVVILAGVVQVIARLLAIDAEWLLSLVGAVAAFAVATLLVYAIYRVLPSSPPAPRSARLPAFLVGLAISLLTLAYGLLAPWLVSGFRMFGVVATVFVALVWLRFVFLALVLGAAMTRYRDRVAYAAASGVTEPDAVVTSHLLQEEDEVAAGAAAAAAAIEAAERSDAADGVEAPGEGGADPTPDDGDRSVPTATDAEDGRDTDVATDRSG